MNKYREEIVPRIYNDYQRILKESMVRGIPAPANKFAGLSTGEFENLGQCGYLIDGDVKAMKNWFYNAVVAAQRVLELYDEDNGLKVTMGVTMMVYPLLLRGVISDNKEETVKFAELMGGRPKEEKRHGVHGRNLGYALKYIVMNDFGKAKQYIEVIRKKSLHQFNVGLYETLNGIVTRNEQLFKEGIELRLKKHKKARMYKNTPDEFISLEILGYIKLAKWYGVEIDIEHELIPKDIIEETEVDYQLHEIMLLEY